MALGSSELVLKLGVFSVELGVTACRGDGRDVANSASRSAARWIKVLPSGVERGGCCSVIVSCSAVCWPARL